MPMMFLRPYCQKRYAEKPISQPALYLLAGVGHEVVSRLQHRRSHRRSRDSRFSLSILTVESCIFCTSHNYQSTNISCEQNSILFPTCPPPPTPVLSLGSRQRDCWFSHGTVDETVNRAEEVIVVLLPPYLLSSYVAQTCSCLCRSDSCASISVSTTLSCKASARSYATSASW
jgi:hypothetical protein